MKQLYTLLKSFKHIIVSVQSDGASSLYPVSMCFIKLKETLRFSQSAKKYNHENLDCKKKDGILDNINDEELQYELCLRETFFNNLKHLL